MWHNSNFQNKAFEVEPFNILFIKFQILDRFQKQNNQTMDVSSK